MLTSSAVLIRHGVPRSFFDIAVHIGYVPENLRMTKIVDEDGIVNRPCPRDLVKRHTKLD